MVKRYLYILAFLSFSFVNAQDEMSLFEQANTNYNDGDYQQAIELYERILQSDLHSADVYFNLGNAYYKTNQVGPSIYYYEKALMLSPDDAEILNNLSFAQNMTIDSIESIPKVGFAKISSSVVNTFDFDTWAMLSVTLVIMFVLLFLTYYFSHSTNKKRFLFLSSFSCLFVGLICLSLAFKKFDVEKRDNAAIVFAERTEVKVDPNLRSETAFNLHEGAKVQVVESYDDNWSKIKLSDGKTGWVAVDDIKLLKNF